MMKRLLLLNGLAILGVILFHAAGAGLMAMFAWRDRYLPLLDGSYDPMSSPAYYVLRVIEQLVGFSIPAFLFISGFFIASATGRSRATVSGQIIGARIKHLLMPYFIWSFVLFFLLYFQGRTYTIDRYLVRILTGGADTSYYYVILLCQLYLMSLLLVPLAKTRWILLLVVTALIQLTVQLLQYPVFLGTNSLVLRAFVDVVPKWLFPSRILWFTFGMVTGFHLSDIKGWATRNRRALLATAVSTFLLGIVEWEFYFRRSGPGLLGHRETLINDVYAAAFILSFLAFDKVQIPFSKVIGELGTKSFGIYLGNSVVMLYVARSVYHLVPWVLAYQIILQPLMIAFGLAIPLLLMAAVRRSPAQRYYSYLFG
jgi:hypothetical protein